MTRGFLRSTGEGEAFWFLGTLMTVKAKSEDTRGGFTLVEQIAPPGFGPPPHVHKSEEEAFFLLEGSISVTCGEDSWRVESGGFVFLPRGVPHAFRVGDEGPARLLQITSPAQFEKFMAEVGEPATERVLPPPSVPDVPRLLAAAAKYDYEIVGGGPG